MKRSKEEFSSIEDRILWEKVAKSTRPLKGKDKMEFLLDALQDQTSVNPSAPGENQIEGNACAVSGKAGRCHPSIASD
jgi:hypothetical protein